MMNRVFNRGVGAGKGPVEYCVNAIVPKFDPETRRRIKGEFVTRNPPPVILFGDPKRTISLIDSVDNKWKYTSGVIAFGDQDAPTSEEITEVIKSFERMAFAGLDAEQYDCLWIMHTHEGNVELHYVTPRVELSSGKALNICPPGYLKMFDTWRDSWNFEKGWSRPEDPARAKLIQIGSNLEKTDAARLKAGLEKSGPTKAKLEITDWLVERIKSGLVKNRADVVKSLLEIGTITKSGETFITLHPAGFTKPFRLKGGIYGESFNPSELVADAGIEKGPGRERGGQRDNSRAAEARERLAEAIQRRADYNSSCYHPERRERNAERRAANRSLAAAHAAAIVSDAAAERDNAARISETDFAATAAEFGTTGAIDAAAIAIAGANESAIAADLRSGNESAAGGHPGPDQSAGEAAERCSEFDSAGGREFAAHDSQNVAETSAHKRADLAKHLASSLGADALFGGPGTGESGAATAAGEGAGAAAVADLGGGVPGRSDGPIFDSPPRNETRNWLEIWEQAGRQTWEKLKGVYDRVRTSFDGWVREIGEAIFRGHEAAAGAEFATAGAISAIAESSGRIIAASRAIDAIAPGQRIEIERGSEAHILNFERTAHAAIGVIKMNRDDELQRFKTDIDLISYCAGCGFEIDQTESSRTSTIMRRGPQKSGEKIGVAVDTDGHWVYSDLRNDGKGGSIIDFVQHTQKLNLGQVRKELRSAAGIINEIPIAQRPKRPERSTASRQAVQHAYLKTQVTNGRHAYLQNVRGIDSQILNDPRFNGMVKIDERGNAIFPHYDEKGISGYEIRGQDFKGFSKHGEKSIWCSTNVKTAQEVIFVEGAINALSHAQLNPNLNAGYISIGGQMSPHQKELVAYAMARVHERGAALVLATDADAAGEAHAQALRDLAPAGAQLFRDTPTLGQDWNEQLVQQLVQHQEQERQQGYAPGR
jgi:hypothetical protein